MKLTHRSALPALFLGLTALLSAQPAPTSPGPRPGRPGRGGGHPIVRAIDTNHDGILSAAELAAAPAAIRALDTNGDGTVSADELRAAGRPPNAPTPPAGAPVPPAPPPGAPPRGSDPIMLALDGNGDGELSASEIANAATSLLKALDANGDGQLTPDEYRPLPPADAPHN